MAQSTRGGSSRKDKSHGHKECKSGQIDVVAAYDTRYPDIHKTRAGKGGNGPTPGNPFGHRIARPRVGKGGP